MLSLRSFILAILTLPWAVQAQEIVVPPEARTGLELTIYESDFALVKDQRTLKLTRPEATLAFAGVSGQMQPDTVLFRTLGGEPLRIVEQAFDANVLTPEVLLERALGHEVSVLTTNPATGRDTIERAKVLAVDQGLVLDIGGKIHTQVPGRIVFDGLPEGLRTTPTLLIAVRGKANQDVKSELSYLTGGLSWRTNYVADYDADAKRLDLTAWATLNNNSGIDFKDAKVKLVSGQINKVSERRRPGRDIEEIVVTAARTSMAATADGIQQESLGGYHLYDIADPVSVENNRTKQLSLLGGTGIAATQEYTVRGEQYFYQQQVQQRPPVIQAETVIALKNDKASGLGLPLPAGIVRVYGQDASGAPQFLGEDNVSHTAEGAEMRITIGRDADVTAEREQQNFVRASDRITLVTWRVTLKNAKSKGVAVRVIEPIFGAWEISRETLPHIKANAQVAEWLIDVPAKGQAVLDYTARITN